MSHWQLHGGHGQQGFQLVCPETRHLHEWQAGGLRLAQDASMACRAGGRSAEAALAKSGSCGSELALGFALTGELSSLFFVSCIIV